MDIPQLDPESQSFVDALVEAGRYASHEEVLREGIRLVRDREAKLTRFDAEIMKGVESIKRGEGIPLDEAFDQVIANIRNKAARRAA